MRLFEGVYVANVTPFTEKGTVDFPALESHLNELAKTEIQGFVPCGTTGESPTLSATEWLEVVQLTKNIAKENNLKTIAGCGGNSTEKVLELVRQADEIGVDGVLIVSPYYNKPTKKGLLTHFKKVAAEGVPVVLYNIPSRTNIELSIDLVHELFQDPNIVAIKESTSDFGRWVTLSERIDLSQRSFLAGDDNGFAGVMALGGCGIVSATANALPKAFVSMYKLAQTGKWKEAFELQVEINSFVSTMFLETNPAPIKEALHQLKKMRPDLRLPLVPVEKVTSERITQALKAQRLV